MGKSKKNKRKATKVIKPKKESTYEEILKMAKKPFVTKNNFIVGISEEDLFYETDTCKQLIFLLHKWEDEKVRKSANAIFMHLQAHGLEKVIQTSDDKNYLTTIEDYVENRYPFLKKQELDHFDTYIKENIKYSSTVPSGYCSIVDQPFDDNLESSETTEYNLVSMYMNRYNDHSIYKSRRVATSEGLATLYKIIRIRKRKWFELLNEDIKVPRYSNEKFHKFLRSISKLRDNSENQVSKEYNTGLGLIINNKRFNFTSKEDERDNNLNGIHIFPFIDGKSMVDSNPINISNESVSKELIPPLSMIERVTNMIGKKTPNKQTIINTIQKELASTKILTFADIFLLGWAIGKRLYIFDPSCNGIQDDTTTKKIRNRSIPTFPGMGIPEGVFQYNLLANSRNAHDTPPQSQQESPPLGGKKRNTKRKISINNTKKQNKNYTRRT